MDCFIDRSLLRCSSLLLIIRPINVILIDGNIDMLKQSLQFPQENTR